MRDTSDQQFLADFEAMSARGATAGGGVERQAASHGDRKARAWLTGVLEEMGAEVYFDEIGNQFGLFTFVEGAPYCAVGSHLDSQPLGGRFDGAYGVLAGAHAAARVKRAVEEGSVVPKRNLIVVNWFNEEGSRFEPSMMGSSVYVGKLTLAEAMGATDVAGTSVASAITAANWQPVAALPPIAAYAEIHVEQGKLLEKAGNTIGLVTATWGARKFEVTVRGEQGHTGSTMMADRKDALFGASLIVTGVRFLADEFPEGHLQSSVSKMLIEPNSPVTIAREVSFNIDLRSPDSAVLDAAHRKLEALLADAAKTSDTSVDLHLTHSWELNPYPSPGVELARAVVEELGYPYQEILTVAGHDSTNLKDEVPTVMLFIPSVDGISHNEAEYTAAQDCVAGVHVLAKVAEKMVEGGI